MTAVKARPLAPLAHKRTRILLLLSSYLDALSNPTEDSIGGKPQSRIPGRNADLMARGSYRELERCMDMLQARAPVIYWHTWQHYIRQDANTRVRRGKARAGLEYLVQRMPAYVHVPAEISENAGYLAGEAKAYERSTRRAA